MADWGSDGSDDLGDLGDLSELPEVQLPSPLPTATSSSQSQPSIPAVNAWTQPRKSASSISLPGATSSNDVRVSRGGLQFSNKSNSRTSNSATNSRDRSAGGVSSSTATSTTLYVTNLPLDVREGSVVDFFKSQNVNVANCRLTYHKDTGKIKAAFVTLPATQDVQSALALDATALNGRPLYIKIDGADRRGSDGRRERTAYATSAFAPNGVNAGGTGANANGYGFSRDRDRRNASGSSANSWGSTSSYEPAATSQQERERERGQGGSATDPTIPTGPTPGGRKKLQLKPRTKPKPVLEIDHRAIGDIPSSSSTTSPASAATSTNTGAAASASSSVAAPQRGPRGDGNTRSGNGANVVSSDGFSAARRSTRRGSAAFGRDKRDGGSGTSERAAGSNAQGPPPRQSGANSQRARNEKNEDSAPRLSNAFAVLGMEEEETAA